MAERRRVVLPIAPQQYDFQNESTNRFLLQNAIEQTQNDLVNNQNKTDKDSSLAIRRFQFLLMGAGNG